MPTGKQTAVHRAVLRCINAVLSATSSSLAALAAAGILFLYVTYVVPPMMWLGSVSGTDYTWQNGGPLLSFLSNMFIAFFIMPIAPLVVAYMIFAATAWIFLRSDRETSHKGFMGIVASAFVLALFIMVPARASFLGHEIEALRQSEVAKLNPDGLVRLEHRTDHETMKLYRVLHEAGIATWREDPVAVVKFELADGDLRHLHEADDELSLRYVVNSSDAEFSNAVVDLRNSRVRMQIDLQSYWTDDHRVWLVQGYRPLPETSAAPSP